MVISNCVLHLDLYDVVSLKGRRSVLNKLKEKLKSYNLSFLDVSGEYAKEAEIVFVFLSYDRPGAARYREKIESDLVRIFPEYAIEIEYEEL